jgi:hypothetical protein
VADSKVSALTALSGANVATDDQFYVVDTSTTTGKKISADELRIAVAPAWTSPSFSAGNFTANNSMTWTVAEGDVGTYAYQIQGKRMVVSFVLSSTTVGGTPSTQLLIAIPASKTATKTMITPVRISDNAVDKIGFAQVTASGTTIAISLVDGSAFTAATNNTAVQGQITFEIN